MTSPGAGGGSWQPPTPQGPGWSPPAPAPGWGGPGGPLPPRTNSLAIVALVAGLAQCAVSLIGSIVAIVCGHIARRQIREAQGRETGDGLALAGLILGYIGLALNILAIAGVLIFVLGFSDDVDRAGLRDDARLVRNAIQRDVAGPSLHDPAVILRALSETTEARNSRDRVYLANRVDPALASISDWNESQWQLEFARKSVMQTVYVCMQLRDPPGVFVITNGHCQPGIGP